MNDSTRARLEELHDLRNNLDLEIAHRRFGSQPYHFRECTVDELEVWAIWTRDRIEEILEPFGSALAPLLTDAPLICPPDA